jgi:6-phosphogluconate dehydrogenase
VAAASELADVFEEWNHGTLESFLIEIAIFQVGTTRSGGPLVDRCSTKGRKDGQVGGTGRARPRGSDSDDRRRNRRTRARR